MNTMISRRRFLRTTGLGIGAGLWGVRLPLCAAPAGELLERRVISHEPEYYHGWPTLIRRREGGLMLVYSGGRHHHVCPFGRVELMVSHDEGRTWGWPQVLMDSAIDDRDAGIVETARGSILVTTFTSLAYADRALEKALKVKAGEEGAWPEEKLRPWRAAHERLTEAQRRAELGQWMIRSTDGGVTWSARYPSVVNSPHGPIQLADGRLLYAGKELHGTTGRVGICESRDDGLTWHWLADIAVRSGDAAADYHELHAVETNEGRLVVHIRNHNKTNSGETLQSESTDGGRTWSTPRAIGVWGLPSHLLRLKDGRLLMTYGYRRQPYGNQARFSTDQGRTWSEPMTVSEDGGSGDLGYPSTVELGDGTLLTVWYELPKGSQRAVLRQTRWRPA